MFQSQPNTERKEAGSDKALNGVIAEIFHSAGIVIAGALLSAFLISNEGRNLGHRS